MKTSYRADIDGLRAVAVLAVVLFHAGFTASGSPLFTGGYIGVDVFFVISGYLITRIIAKDLQNRCFSFRHFYERRIRRILPALVFVLTITTVCAWFLVSPENLKSYLESLLHTSLFTANFFFWQHNGYFDAPNQLVPLLHMWSLAVEEQFYLFYPTLLLLLWHYLHNRIATALGIIFIASLGFAIWCSQVDPSANFYLLTSRAWELFAGALVAHSEYKNRVKPNPRLQQILPLIGLIAIVASIGWFDEHSHHPGIITLVPVLGTVAIIKFGGGNDLGTKLLSQKLVVGIGLISYSLYLWHQPLLAIYRDYSVHAPENEQIGMLVLASIVLAAITWRYVETPFRSPQKISKKPLYGSIAALTSIFICTGAYGYQGFDKYSQLSDPKLRWAGDFIHQDNHPCHNRIPQDACVFGNQQAQQSWLIVGDSNVLPVTASLYDTLDMEHTKLSILTYDACPYVFGFATDYQRKQCEITNVNRRAIFKNLPPSTIIYGGRFPMYISGTGFNNGEGGVEFGGTPLSYLGKETTEQERKALLKKYTINSVRELLSWGHRVVLLYPIPEVGWNAPNTVDKVSPERLTTSYARFKERTQESYEMLDAIGQHPNLIRVYPEKRFCNTEIDDRCMVDKLGKILYSDDDHLSYYGGILLTQEILTQVMNWERSR